VQLIPWWCRARQLGTARAWGAAHLGRAWALRWPKHLCKWRDATVVSRVWRDLMCAVCSLREVSVAAHVQEMATSVMMRDRPQARKRQNAPHSTRGSVVGRWVCGQGVTQVRCVRPERDAREREKAEKQIDTESVRRGADVGSCNALIILASFSLYVIFFTGTAPPLAPPLGAPAAGAPPLLSALGGISLWFWSHCALSRRASATC
jgi:hypothetical protein